MYEYKCVSESCNQTWTIKEGDISSLYLTCPYCKKGRGTFLRQIKNDTNHDDIKNIVQRKQNAEAEKAAAAESKAETVEKKTEETTPVAERNVEVKKEAVKVEEPKKEEVKEVEHKKDTSEKKERKKPEVKVNVPEVEEAEEDIFTRIKRKRAQEEEFKKNIEDEQEVDTLEIAGSSLEEIENRIREFEDYYYIKVLDRSVQQQGKRYNCIIKYCRK